MLFPALEELMKDELDAYWQAGWQEGVILGTAEAYRELLGLDNATLTDKIAAEFHLTAEQAAEYIQTQET